MIVKNICRIYNIFKFMTHVVNIIYRAFIISSFKHFAIHRWRYSKPKYVDTERFMLIQNNPTLIIAGDAFAGPRVEGAFLSGYSAAEALIAHFEKS